jgi:hypothetical protein
MTEKGFPTYLIRTVRSMYQNTTIITRKARVNNVTYLINSLAGSSSVNMVQHATMDEPAFSIR